MNPNLPAILVLIAFLLVVIAVVVVMIVRKAKGKSSCSCGCGGCAMREVCHSKKEKDEAGAEEKGEQESPNQEPYDK
jgi:hypothetical protein